MYLILSFFFHFSYTKLLKNHQGVFKNHKWFKSSFCQKKNGLKALNAHSTFFFLQFDSLPTRGFAGLSMVVIV